MTNDSATVCDAGQQMNFAALGPPAAYTSNELNKSREGDETSAVLTAIAWTCCLMNNVAIDGCQSTINSTIVRTFRWHLSYGLYLKQIATLLVPSA
jgi:hypothetical protein